MEKILILITLLFPFMGTVLWVLFKVIRFIRSQHSTRNIFQLGIDMVMLPFSFSKIFLQRRKEKELPLYFQYFLSFTRFCSRIPYFHFFPKFVVATIAEVSVHFITHQPLLTALIYSWSLFFLIIITMVESMYGEFDEDVITLANKLFLYSVSMIVLFCLMVWAFFWKVVEPSLDNWFLQMMSKVAEFSNEKMWELIVAFWGWPLSIKFLILLALGLYVSSSLYLSKKGIK